ncbi:MAG: DUF5979 domain-containing protein [Oscillospiraceae bacterium]|nr:DUF5979 domain-containing protein [Oscillospiraceae bacterium]
MKTMKKLLALVMALALCLSLGVCALATGEVTGSDKVTVTKTLSATGLEETTFKYTVTATGMTGQASTVTEQPTISDFEITVAKGETTGTKDIDLTGFTALGVYTYTITEQASNIAGVTDDTTTLYLTVTVVNEVDDDGQPTGDYVRSVTLRYGNATTGDKTDNDVANTYNAYTLTVIKDVTGNLGDTSEKFSVKVTFTNNTGKAINSIITCSDNQTVELTDWTDNVATVTITVQDGSEITFSNIPSGVSYTVEELDSSKVAVADGGKNGNYTVSYDSNATSTGITADVSTTITNDYDSNVDTGITLDSLPYVLVLVAVLALGAVMIIRKRRVED